MIRISRKSLREPGITRDKDFITFVDSIVENGQFEYHPTYFRKITAGLRELYNHKCAYCESRIITAASYMAIDHYRPKGKLKSKDPHPGYYWLGYEWTNLIPTCSICNSHKSSRFPVKGPRITAPPLKNRKLDRIFCHIFSTIHRKEKPLLLHPEIHEPEKHLVFKPNGTVESKTEEGNGTIITCKLNRSPLVIERKLQKDRFYNEIKKYFLDFVEERIDKNTFWYCLDGLFDKIKTANAPERPYSRFGWFLFHDFETFFCKPLEAELNNNLRPLVVFLRKAFQRFINTGKCGK